MFGSHFMSMESLIVTLKEYFYQELFTFVIFLWIVKSVIETHYPDGPA